MTFKTPVVMVFAAVMSMAAGNAAAQPPRELYARALERDRTVRDAKHEATLHELRLAVAAYERVVRRYPASGYSDNALWQASELSRLAWERFSDPADKRASVRFLTQLKSGYPSSSLVARADEALQQWDASTSSGSPRTTQKSDKQTDTVTAAADSRPAKSQPAVVPAIARKVAPEPTDDPAPETREKKEAKVATPTSTSSGVVTLRNITRTALIDGVRVSLEMDRELIFHQEELENPKRLFFDLRGALISPALRGKSLTFQDDIVREIRLGLRPDNTTRVVMNTEGVESFTVFTLYNPYRLIVDFRRKGAPIAKLPLLPVPPPVSTTGIMRALPKSTEAKAPTAPPPAAVTPPAPVAPPAAAPTVIAGPLPSRDITVTDIPAPTLPTANSTGGFSLSRQLGLGVSRIVIDPGHGGHDPGAISNGINESELVLDVSMRLKKMLENEPGVEVVMTRDTDVFIPLDMRTAIANRESADLFLSIHANASRNPKARGVETYFLNFAANPEAEAVAARENSSSGQTMHKLPDIVRAIALNNKLDESRDFAAAVQRSMVRKLTPRNREMRDLGVKQAPFVVLIGAGMPSVLAEIAFVSNKPESQLLKTTAYRQQIAEALFDAVTKYQKSLKVRSTIASRHE
jgi:N-acetylmuramoyl-L-alanine amidase